MADVVVDDSVIPRDVLASAAVKSELLGREVRGCSIAKLHEDVKLYFDVLSSLRSDWIWV